MYKMYNFSFINARMHFKNTDMDNRCQLNRLFVAAITI